MKASRKSSVILLGLIALFILSACSPKVSTEDWKVFTISEEPAINIQFRLPPEWYVDYAPKIDVPGQWDVALVPPRCAEDQQTDFEDNCISLTIHLKETSAFDKPGFLAFASQSITLNQSGTEKTIMMGQTTSEVDGLTLQRYNHKFMIGEDEVQMSLLFFETDSAYYIFISELPYDEREGEVAALFDLLIGSIEVID